MALTREDILKYFEEINRHLAEKDKIGEIIMAGGAALTLVYNARGSTHDIDAVFSPKEDLREIIKRVGGEYDLDDDWLNDGVKGFFTEKMTASIYKQYSHLTILSLDAECLLAMKLSSARGTGKDRSDSITLMKHLGIKNIDELYEIIEKYVHKNQLTAKAKFFTIEAFESYYKEVNKNRVTKPKKPLLKQVEENKKLIDEHENADSDLNKAKKDKESL